MTHAPESPLLLLDDYGVALGQRIVLHGVNLSVSKRGITALVGPSGEGKSTLVRTLSGLNDCRPAVRSWGTAEFEGRPLGQGRRPTLIIQKLRLLTSSLREYIVSALPKRHELTLADQRELLCALFQRLGCPEYGRQLETGVVDFPLGIQRQLALARAYAMEVPLFCADEPDAGLQEDEVTPLLSLMQRIGEERAVLWITHNQAYARRTSRFMALLAGGRICESGTTAHFFAGPSTEAGRDYIKTGRCGLPSPMARAEEIADEDSLPLPLPLTAVAPNPVRGPTDFFWLLPNALGGLPRPGIVADVADDVAGLRRLGITLLVTLEETRTVDLDVLERFGLHSRFFPIPDMGVPGVAEAIEFVRSIHRECQTGSVVALHCRAGMGRTGTMLACHLLLLGATPLEALERVRNINPRWIQSERQVRFLTEFAGALRREPIHYQHTMPSPHTLSEQINATN